MSNANWTETQDNVSDARREAASLVDMLSGLRACLTIAQKIDADLECAESCESEADMIANLAAAAKGCDDLAVALKKARAEAKSDGDDAAVETTREAVSALRGLRREIAEVQS